jgi:hypothetical protein
MNISLEQLEQVEIDKADFYAKKIDGERVFLKVFPWEELHRKITIILPACLAKEQGIIVYEKVQYKLFWHKHTTQESILASEYVGCSFHQVLSEDADYDSYVVLKPWKRPDKIDKFSRAWSSKQ